MTSSLAVAVLGASGYTGAELLRLAAGHDGLRIAALTGHRSAGRPLAAVHPHLAHLDLPDLVAGDDVDWSAIDAVFCCLPHGAAQDAIAALPAHARIVDLSADFRLADADLYARWYGGRHRAPALLAEAVYGLTELRRQEVRKARLVANPGCYTTAAELPLIPCLEAGAISPEGIVIDAKSGVSGAGREASQAHLHAEVSEGVRAYGIAGHRHLPEIEQELAQAAGRAVAVTFTPHLVPMNRGILATVYAGLADGAEAGDVRAALATRYRDEAFVHVLAPGRAPATHHVRGSNLCLIAVFADRVPRRVILVSALDNLVKGAAGQALQNLNAMAGFDEGRGLAHLAVFP